MKLRNTFDDLEVFQGGRAGLAPRVKNFMCKLNSTNFNFVVQQQLRKFIISFRNELQGGFLVKPAR